MAKSDLLFMSEDLSFSLFVCHVFHPGWAYVCVQAGILFALQFRLSDKSISVLCVCRSVSSMLSFSGSDSVLCALTKHSLLASLLQWHCQLPEVPKWLMCVCVSVWI